MSGAVYSENLAPVAAAAAVVKEVLAVVALRGARSTSPERLFTPVGLICRLLPLFHSAHDAVCEEWIRGSAQGIIRWKERPEAAHMQQSTNRGRAIKTTAVRRIRSYCRCWTTGSVCDGGMTPNT